METLSIAAFLDGRPGHEKQTMAIIQAISRMTPVAARFVRLPSSRQVPAGKLSSWFPILADNKQVLSINGSTDLVIGAGRRTHLPMLLYNRKLPSPARLVVCMAPGRFLISRFDLCLVPFHDNIRDTENIVSTVGPPCLSLDRGRHDSSKGLILVGGIDEKSHFWDGEGIVYRVANILRDCPEIHWTISSSPRTPRHTLEQLERLTIKNGTAVFRQAENTRRGWLEEQYDHSRTVWVTADSVSMIYEALTAGCRVGILPVQWKRRNNKFQRSLAFLKERRLVLFFDEWLAGAEFPTAGADLDEAGRCSMEILRRWWPDRLLP